MTKKVDDNGWWIIKDNPLSKVGIYPYLGKQIDDSLEPNKVYRVFRPAEELLNKETVKSFNLVPLINDHEMLGKDFKPAEKKGIDGIIYNPRVAHEDMLIGNIKIYSEKMMRDIKNGKKELSMGYTCTYDLTPGDWDGQHYDVVQRNLRGNHVALVDRGRMGSEVRVYDKHVCCDSMDITGKIKKVPAEDLTEESWQLRKDTGLNYVTKRHESTINKLIKQSGLPLARKTEATKLFGYPSYRNRFDAKFKEDEAWLNAQKVRFKQTRKKVGLKNMLKMPSYQKFLAKQEELRDIFERRNAIEHEVYGDRAGLDTAWIKVPGETEEPNILDRVVTKSAEAAAIMALLSTVLKMDKKKKIANDLIGGNEMNISKKKAALDKALNRKLYKLGKSYGKQLLNIYGKKYANDAGYVDQIFNKGIASLSNKSPEAAEFLTKLVHKPSSLLNSTWGQPAANAVQSVSNAVKPYSSISEIGKHSPVAAEFLAKAMYKPSSLGNSAFVKGMRSSLQNTSQNIIGAAQKAVEFGGSHAANFGNSIAGLAGKVSPKAAKLFAKYPKTTGLAAAAAITSALAGAGYGAYKLYNSKSNKNSRKK